MTTQPKALRLADELTHHYADRPLCSAMFAAAELRRLHTLNQQLLQALKNLLDDADPCGCTDEYDECPLLAARAAIAKAEGETNASHT